LAPPLRDFSSFHAVAGLIHWLGSDPEQSLEDCLLWTMRYLLAVV
jgi:hypothetical protein